MSLQQTPKSAHNYYPLNATRRAACSTLAADSERTLNSIRYVESSFTEIHLHAWRNCNELGEGGTCSLCPIWICTCNWIILYDVCKPFRQHWNSPFMVTLYSSPSHFLYGRGL